MEEKMDKMLDYLCELQTENEALRMKLYEADRAVGVKNTKGFLKGLGAGITVTPLAVWVAWMLVELLEVAADWIGVTPAFLATLAVCIVGGGILYLHSESVINRTDKLLATLFEGTALEDDDVFGEEDDCFDWPCERGK